MQKFLSSMIEIERCRLHQKKIKELTVISCALRGEEKKADSPFLPTNPNIVLLGWIGYNNEIPVAKK